MKTTCICLLSLAAFVCLSALAPSAKSLAQSNAHPDYYHQHKDAQKYQKHLMKQAHKQEKAQAKAAKADRKRHQ